MSKFYISEALFNTFEKTKNRMKAYIAKNCIAENIDCEKLKVLINRYKTDKNSSQASYDSIYHGENASTRMHMSLNEINTDQILINGSADLLSSIMNVIDKTSEIVENEFGVNSYINYGIREHAMFGIMNGISAHGIFLPVGSTFLAFSTYGLGAIRMACIDNLKVIYLLSHDTIKLGEDGTTHQPNEEVAILRSICNLVTLRPCDGKETRSALAMAIKEEGPVAIILSRQSMPDLSYTNDGNTKYCFPNQKNNVSDVEKGAYYLNKEDDHEIILLATGSEVELAFDVKMNMRDKKISVVSMISFELFERQPIEYKEYVIDRDAFIISIEALSTFGWVKYSDFQIGLDSYGMSAPGEYVYSHFGFTPERIANRIRLFIDK